MKREYLDVLRQLRKHHSLFAQFWTVGDIVEIDHPKMPTAGIAFDKKTGKGIQFFINPNFWARLSDDSKAFVIGHECLHVYFDHGRRSLGLDREIANLAQDVVINHYLVDVFGFKREELTFGEKYCWRDTMFPGRDDIEADRCFEYYYQKLLEQGGPPKQEGEGQEGESGMPREGASDPGEGNPGAGPANQTVDVHEFMDEVDDEMLDAIQEAVDELMDRITPGEVEDFEEMVEAGNQEESAKLQEQQQKHAGTMSGGMKTRIRLGRIVKKRKWETIVEQEIGRMIGMIRDQDLELWTRPNRRISAMAGDLILPATVTEEVPVRDRIDVWFFQDTSGSCREYAERFFKAAATIPEDRFRVRMFCFDTKVYETTLESGQLYGFGGTAFQPIEDAIQSVLNKEEKTKYPQRVFVITDGIGSPVCPEHPGRWHWFITEGYSSTQYVPERSRHYKLADYE